MIFVNFKTYEEGTGSNALELSKILEEAAEEAQIKIIPVVQAADVSEVAQILKLEIWVQKVDPVTFGAHTGSMLPEAIAEDGARGTFLNHSESKFENFNELEAANKRAREVGLKTLIFAQDLDALKKVITLEPTFVAYEPPELIASKNTSVSRAKPEIIADAAKIAKTAGVPLIVGAGVKDSGDVRKSLELGAVGVAVSSAVILAEDPKKVVLELASGFKA